MAHFLSSRVAFARMCTHHIVKTTSGSLVNQLWLTHEREVLWARYCWGLKFYSSWGKTSCISETMPSWSLTLYQNLRVSFERSMMADISDRNFREASLTLGFRCMFIYCDHIHFIIPRVIISFHGSHRCLLRWSLTSNEDRVSKKHS